MKWFFRIGVSMCMYVTPVTITENRSKLKFYISCQKGTRDNVLFKPIFNTTLQNGKNLIKGKLLIFIF